MSTTPPPPPGDFPGQSGGTPPPPGGVPTPPPVGGPGTPPPPTGFSAVSGGGMGGGSAPPPIQKKGGLPGWGWALIIVGGLLLVCGGGSCAAVVLLGSAAEDTIDDVGQDLEDAADEFDEQFGEVDPSEYEVEFESCEADQFGLGEAVGTITNNTGQAEGFSIEIEFKDGSGTIVGTGFTTVSEIGDGETAQFSAILGGTADGGALECEVTSVTRFG